MEVSGRKVLQHFCEPCGDNGQKLLAAGFCVDCSEFLCRDCYIHHCRVRAFRNHVLQDESSMPKTKPDFSPLKSENTENECSKHKGEIIKFYCRSDSTFGCGSCIALDHHGCDKPVYIQEEYEMFKTKLDRLNEQLDYHSNKRDNNSTAIKSHHLKVSQDIRSFMTKVKGYFENLELSMITETDKIKDDDEQNMNAISTTCMTLKNDLQSLTSDLFNLQQTTQNKKLFTLMEEAGDQTKRIAMNIDQMNTDNKVHIYSFLPERHIEDMMKTLTILGKLAFENETSQADILKTSDEGMERKDADVNTIQPLSDASQIMQEKIEINAAVKPEHIPFEHRRASYSAQINVTSSDTGNTCIRGLALLPNDNLILTDSANSKVKLISATQNKLISELNLSSMPYDITAINDNQVAVTMPDANQIQMLFTSNQNIFLGETIDVNGQCHSLVHNEGTLIVTFLNPAKIKLISMNGAVLRVIDKGINGEHLFEKSEYIALSLDKTHVYISDSSKGSVTCMALDGTVKGFYDALLCPRCLTIDKTGSVYVVVGAYPLFNIYQISGDCSQGQELLGHELGFWCPWSIAYCHKEDKLYVGDDATFNKLDEETANIKVFQLK